MIHQGHDSRVINQNTCYMFIVYVFLPYPVLEFLKLNKDSSVKDYGFFLKCSFVAFLNIFGIILIDLLYLVTCIMYNGSILRIVFVYYVLDLAF